MAEAYLHTEQSSSSETPMELILRGFTGYVHQTETEKQYYQQRCAEYEAEQQALPAMSVVAEGKQKELIAIFNVMYKAGYFVGITQKEFMERQAKTLGCPGMANYTGALYNIKTAYKYDEIFDSLLEVARKEKIG